MSFVKRYLYSLCEGFLNEVLAKQNADIAAVRAEAAATATAEASVEAALVAELKREIAELREAVNILHNELAKESAFTASEINHLHVSKRDGINVRAIRPFRQ